MSSESAEALLAVENVSITVNLPTGPVEAVQGVSFEVRRGAAVGLVGESGSGKTLTCRSVLGVLGPGVAVSGGRILLDGQDLAHLDEADWTGVRGRRIGAVFQDPASYLNPSLTVGAQLSEVQRVKLGHGRRQARERSIELLAAMGLRDPERVYHQLPGELSGGMLQRVLIAIAISCEPQLLVADEATTALDVTVQAEVLSLLRTLRDERGLAILFVSHDLAVIAELCDTVAVFYAGQIVELAPAAALVADPLHPYAEALLRVAAPEADSVAGYEVIPGAPPPLGRHAAGCRFAPRCPHATSRCREQEIPLVRLPDGRSVRCLLGAERASDREPAGAGMGAP